jgi:hypothetical protein
VTAQLLQADLLRAAILRAAIAYAAAGLSVIPIAGDKRPVMDWKPYQSRAAAPAEITAWFGQRRYPNLGLVCGRVSGGLLVLDFDHQAADTYRLWREQAAPLSYRLPVVATGKGLHVYLRTAEPPGNRKLAVDQEKRPLIETRGEGGYVLAPPSRHPSGKLYGWLRGGPPIPELSADETAFVVVAAQAFDQRPARAAQASTPKKTRPALGGNNAARATNDAARLESYAAAVLRGEAEQLQAIPSGDRNNQLNLAAFKAGRYVAAGLLDVQTVEAALAAACGQQGNRLITDDGLRAFDATLQSGLRGGAGDPVCPNALLAHLKNESAMENAT